jgi:hypothetical protein
MLIFANFLSDIAEIEYGEFIILTWYMAMITFFLMNLLLAVVGSTYEKVLSNVKAIDAQVVSYMVYEYETIVHRFFKSKVIPGRSYITFSNSA